MGLAAPYLLQLGLSRSALSIALMAGPLSGRSRVDDASCR